MQGSWLDVIESHDPAIARAISRPPSVVIGARPGSTSEMTSFMWPSYRWFSDMVRLRGPFRHSGSRGWLRPLTSVVYDPENWEATPLRERARPVTYFRRFSVIGHSHGWTVVITPNPNLTVASDASCAERNGEDDDEAFLRCDLIGEAARYADVVEVQAQQIEGNTAAYRSFVEHAAQQARAANPDVQVVAGLTTGSAFTAAQMFAAWDSVRNLVDGYYLSMPGDERSATALAFLHMLPFPPDTVSSSS